MPSNDIFVLALAAAFFVGMWAYVWLCSRA